MRRGKTWATQILCCKLNVDPNYDLAAAGLNRMRGRWFLCGRWLVYFFCTLLRTCCSRWGAEKMLACGLCIAAYEKKAALALRQNVCWSLSSKIIPFFFLSRPTLSSVSFPKTCRKTFLRPYRDPRSRFSLAPPDPISNNSTEFL